MSFPPSAAGASSLSSSRLTYPSNGYGYNVHEGSDTSSASSPDVAAFSHAHAHGGLHSALAGQHRPSGRPGWGEALAQAGTPEGRSPGGMGRSVRRDGVDDGGFPTKDSRSHASPRHVHDPNRPVASPMIPSPFSPHWQSDNQVSSAASSPAGSSSRRPAGMERTTHRAHPYAQPETDPKSARQKVTQANEDHGTGPNASQSGRANGTEAPLDPRQKSGRAGNRRRQKFTRTRTGCLCCRARRIKCDEGRPVCKRCIIAKRTCQYPEGSEGRHDATERGDGKYSRTGSEASDSEDDGPRRGKAQAVEAASGTDENVGQGNVYDSQAVAGDMLLGGGLVNAGDFIWDQSFVGAYNAAPGRAEREAAAMGGDAADVTSAPVDLVGKPQSWGVQGGAPMLSTPNFLLPWFPTAEERSLILHYCANAADLMMAIPSGLNPMLAINLPLALDSPRGMNPSADALRVALLGIGAIHQAFLLARSGVSTAQTAAMFQYASNLRDTGKEMVRRAATEGGGAGSDAALGAGTALSTIDIFFGGSGWQENFRLAKEMVAFRGGPAAMLKASQPTQLADGVSVSAARLMLEILAIYETFGCLTTGQEPTLISDKWENWWFEGSRSTYEEHSVEKQFGMSRVMVHLFSRITGLLSRVASSSKIITETDAVPFLDPLTTDTTNPKPQSSPDSSNASGSASSANGDAITTLSRRGAALPGLMGFIADPLVLEARQLNEDVDAWIESLQLTTLEHERVQVGNRAYAHAMKILLLRMVFKYPRDHACVQSAAMEVLKHCSTSTALLGMSIDLTWPAIIAGCCVDGAARQWLLTLLEGFKSQCCFDIETASRIIQEVWRRVDNSEPRADWKPVCEDFGLQVLLC